MLSFWCDGSGECVCELYEVSFECDVGGCGLGVSVLCGFVVSE